MFVTPVYGALVATLFLALSIRVIRTRRALSVGLGDGGHRILQRQLRAHSNCAEYVPITLILMAFAELQGTPAWPLHITGTLLLIGRVTHAFGFGREPEVSGSRTVGMAMTFSAIITAITANLFAIDWMRLT